MGWKGSLVELPIWAAGKLSRSRVGVPCHTPSILLFRPTDLGDVLTLTPTFQAVRSTFPNSKIVAGIGPWAADIVANNPYVDEVLPINAPWNNKYVADQSWPAVARYLFRSDEVRSFRERGGFDVGIDALGSHVGSVLMMRMGVRYRVGVRGYRGGWSACQKYIRFSPDVHVGRAALAQAELLGATHLPEVRPQLFLTTAEVEDGERRWGPRKAGAIRLLVGTGAGLPEKTWPVNELAAALRLISANAGRPVQIILCGGNADRERANAVVGSVANDIHSACGDISLRTTFALASTADVILTNPSMLLHVAAAFRRPTVAVLGGMYADAKTHDVLWGYPPPYQSVAPVAGHISATAWPTVDQVVDAMMGHIRRVP